MAREFSDPEADLFLQMIAKREARRGKEPRSLVYYFAESRAERSSGELRVLDSLYVDFDLVDLKSLSDEHKRRSIPHLSQIFLGNTIMAIEETLIAGSYSHYFYTARIKANLSGTAWNDAVKVGDNVETPIDPNNMKVMYGAARSDPTLAAFIENPILMPKAMYELMAGLNLYNPVRLVALGDYRRKASRLVHID